MNHNKERKSKPILREAIKEGFFDIDTTYPLLVLLTEAFIYYFVKSPFIFLLGLLAATYFFGINARCEFRSEDTKTGNCVSVIAFAFYSVTNAIEAFVLLVGTGISMSRGEFQAFCKLFMQIFVATTIFLVVIHLIVCAYSAYQYVRLQKFLQECEKE